MKKIAGILLVTAMLTALILAGCQSGNTVDDAYVYDIEDYSDLLQFRGPDDDTPIAVMHTNMGDITLMFFPEQAPKAVENFLTHAKDGYYDGVTFHRVVEGFMIQGGDPGGDGTGGQSIWGEAFEDEFSNEIFNFRGALSMANSGTNTNGSQFFIVQTDELLSEYRDRESYEKAGYPSAAIDAYFEVGGTAYLDPRHTVFGHVVDGMDVVDAIAAVPVVDARNGDHRPIEEVVIKSIDVKNY